MENKTATITDLVAGYSAYTEAGELNVSAAAGAPATTWICASVAVSRTSSVRCSAAVSAASGATYEWTC
ncbi:LxmA leader domain family RiPP [Streptomyces huiliensis]|uniref:LxmA leader domain family RiPP n=1 Tax=Streptomyces huiliensis TaxID=2876027 RepID=UPI001CBB9166|nr:LxmA leader domain family RiPP [Streptomyces huiliensis]MBZ4320391.1 LxmA leader domain family RiPP [Streptomyces huiliensis]